VTPSIGRRAAGPCVLRLRAAMSVPEYRSKSALFRGKGRASGRFERYGFFPAAGNSDRFTFLQRYPVPLTGVDVFEAPG